MEFLYPKSRQFPFDEVCEQIVRALQARNWKVPGFLVKFYDYGSGAQKLRRVLSVTSDQTDIKIAFGRPQGTLPGGRWHDCAAVAEVQLPKRSLRVYEDESGPTYHVYVGDDWERDRSTWWTRLNARLDKDPRLCVHYKGAYPRYHGERPVHLDAERDFREYEPEGDEPQSFCTDTVMEEFRAYLADIVLPAIEAYPTVEVVEPAPEPLISMPDGAGPFFTYGNGGDARRIELGKEEIDALSPPDRYGLSGSGWRLAPLGIKHGSDLPDVAYEGFLWCGITPKVPSEHGNWSDDVLIKVIPKDARGIFVADHAAYEKRRAELAATIFPQGRDCFTDAEVNDFLRARACTIVPLVEYKGGYENPVYLINRELGLDEVEVIGKRPS